MVRSVVRDVARGFGENDLFTSSSAIAFPAVMTLIPLLACSLALLGVLHLEDVWSAHLAPEVRHSASASAFKIVDAFVKKATSGEARGLWLLIGIPIMIWQASAAVRALSASLCRIYCVDEPRSGLRRWLGSFALGLVCPVLALLAFAVVRFTPALTEGVVFAVLRWPVAFVVLTLLVGLLVHYAPGREVPMRWASTGSVVCVAVWLLFSVGFGFYATEVVDYASIFPTLGLVFVTMIYFWLSVCALLVGAQLDAVVRQRRTGSRSGVSAGRRRSRAEGATPRPVR
jgi:membrane protein